MRTAPSNRAGAALCIVTLALWQIAQRIGAIQRVIQAAPAGVRRVQRKAGVHDRHNQLRAGQIGDLGIDRRCLNREIGAFGHQIADV